MVLRAAAGIANERGGRRGMPPIANVLDLLPEKLREEVTDDAKAALDNCGVPDLIEALRQILGWRELRSGEGFPVERVEEIARNAISLAEWR
jgi:hypothetical protein